MAGAGDRRVGVTDGLAPAVRRLVDRVSHWTPRRWGVPSRPGPSRLGPSRAELVHGLVQEVADLAADAEGQPCRPVPRLDNDLALPDQLRVVAGDLAGAAPGAAVLAGAAERVAAVSRALVG
jgi:hypothetical protein